MDSDYWDTEGFGDVGIECEYLIGGLIRECRLFSCLYCYNLRS